MTEPALLRIEQLRKSFGGLHALDGIDLQIRSGETVGVIGPNGAGKTALLNTITGFYKATSGSISFLGQEISGLSIDRIARLGIGRTFQNIRLFKRMSVLENVMAAHKAFATRPLGALLGFSERKRSFDQAMQWLELLQLADKADESAGSLSYGDARRLEIARALAGRPALLLLDEPAAGMNESETRQLINDIRIIKASVGAILLIEHDMGLIRRLSDRVMAMDYGQKIAEGSAAAVLGHPEVLKAYLGEEEGA